MRDSWRNPGACIAHPQDIVLADLQNDDHAHVVALSCGRLETNRLVSLGFTPGAEVSMARNYGHGPLIVIVRGGRVALGRGEARSILLERSAA